MVLEMLKNGIFLLRKSSTNISLAAFIIIDVEGYSFTLFFKKITGNIFLSTFLKTRFSN